MSPWDKHPIERVAATYLGDAFPFPNIRTESESCGRVQLNVLVSTSKRCFQRCFHAVGSGRYKSRVFFSELSHGVNPPLMMDQAEK